MSGILSPGRTMDLEALAGRYEIFFVDQFGVLHDGTAPYPGAVEAVVRLKNAGKRIVLLSNSGKRAAPNEVRLKRLGFPDGAWDLFLSSGEVAWRIFFDLMHGSIAPGESLPASPADPHPQSLPILSLSNGGREARPSAPWSSPSPLRGGARGGGTIEDSESIRDNRGLAGESRLAPGARCLLIARDGDRTVIEGLDLERVNDGADADLVLIAGSEGERFPLDHYRMLLEPAARAGVPCFCTNPDTIMLTPVGPRFGAGAIADLYEELGGTVRRIGKPYPEIYHAALAALGDPPAETVLCVGDSIEHDIAGARSAGLASALVRSGILANLPEEALDDEIARHGVAPDFILPAFAWTG